MKMAILLDKIYSSNATIIKIHMSFLTETGKIIKIHIETQKTPDTQCNPEPK